MFYSKSAILTGSCYWHNYAITGLFFFKVIFEFVLFKRGINSLKLNSVIIFAYFIL